MKKLLLFVHILISVSLYAQTRKDYKLIKRYLVDLNNDGRVDIITLRSSLKEKGLFNQVTISITGFKKQTFNARYSWTFIDKHFLNVNKNALNSEDIYIKKTKLQSVILLFGTLDGAGYREEFSIINVENDSVKMVFGKSNQNSEFEVQNPITLGTLNYGERLNFVFRYIGEFGAYIKERNADVSTYIPYFVYTISNDCKLNKPLMKKYNQKHYVFAGYEFSEKIQILNPRNGSKPSVYKK